MRTGFTTGSCAAAAAKAAAYMLLTGKIKEEIVIMTPKGVPFKAEIRDIDRREGRVSCAVKKDGGDDPDVTDGALIYAAVSRREGAGREIRIEGGEGVGRVTKPGLDLPVGQAAINRVPRKMIADEVREVCDVLDYSENLDVEIFVPEGRRLAEQTFNPRLGIEGGISILGTSGIVEPMSSQAVLETIRLELKQKRLAGEDRVIVSPGNYGQEFMKKTYGYDLDRSVKISNFVGETLDMAAELGFKKLLIVGHIGKLIKVAGGMMNTHSREGDCRMELLAAFAVRQGADAHTARRILDCVVTEEAVAILAECGKRQDVMEYAASRICFYMDRRTGGAVRTDCILYANEWGELAKSGEVSEWFTS